MRRLYSGANLQDAYLVLHLLERAGIEARVFNQHAQGGMGELPFTHVYPEVWVVDPRDETSARQIVADYERLPAATGTFACPACGEPNPQSFELCWRCGVMFN